MIRPSALTADVILRPGAFCCLAGMLAALFCPFASAAEDAMSDGSPSAVTISEPSSSNPDAAPQPIPFALQPYRVQLRLSLPQTAAFPEAVRQTLRRQTLAWLKSRFGPAWEIELAPDSAMTSGQMATLGDDDLKVLLKDNFADKTFLLGAEDCDSNLRIWCREWDANSESAGPLAESIVLDRRELASALGAAVCDSFRPIAELEMLQGRTGEAIIKGGELSPRMSELAYFRPGDALVPYLRYLDRKLEVRLIQPLPWTYLKTESVDRGRLQLTMTSAFQSPIPQARRRVQVMLMRARPQFSETALRIVPRGRPGQALAGVRCEVLDREPTQDDPVDAFTTLMTDRQGRVRLPVDPEHPLKFLRIQSGGALLARVPVIPGVLPELELETPDDSARLNVEGEVSLLHAKLIDLVATREVMMARSRDALKGKRWKELDGLLQEVRALPTLEQFRSRVDVLEVQAVYTAQQARDRVAESRIKRLCASVRDSAAKHLDAGRLTDFLQEMDSLKEVN